tara:strand:+ start:563 stop:1138 length:576 start_codon:yes stop_codon:yes gene_type:complete
LENNFKIGDKVRFLNADGFGVVTKILNNKEVEIENDFGFEEVFKIKELVPERKKEDYQTDNLAFNKQVSSKINSEINNKRSNDLKKKFNHLDQYGNKDRDILDLHIENLIDSHRGMNNSEILNIQMMHFRRFLNSSISKQHRKIVVIHGVGEGVLRQEIRRDLHHYHSHLEFYDAPYNEFGYGATEIRLKK